MEKLGGGGDIKPTADVIGQVVLLGPDLPDHWDELELDSDEQELPEEGEEGWVLGLLVVDGVDNCNVVTEECDSSACPVLPPEPAGHYQDEELLDMDGDGGILEIFGEQS